MKQDAIERMARAYVELCGNKAAAIKQCSPGMGKKSDKACESMFDRVYGDLPAFWQRVAALSAKVEERIAMTAADLMAHWSMLAGVDVSKIVQIKARPCPACWDDGDVHHDANDECTVCHGEGFPSVAITATDKLTPAERMLYDGAEMTKHGIKVKFRDRGQIEQNIGRALGMFSEKLILQAGSGPVELPPLPDDPNEAARMYAQWIKGS